MIVLWCEHGGVIVQHLIVVWCKEHGGMIVLNLLFSSAREGGLIGQGLIV